MSAKSLKCDIILPVCDQFEFTEPCIESMISNTDTPFRLIVINNGKNPRTRQYLNALEKRTDCETLIVHNDHNIGWVKALNKGMELSTAPYICFQNDDTVVTKGWLGKLIKHLEARPENGLINPEWEGRPGHVSYEDYNASLEKKHKGECVETDWCRGFSVVLKRAVYEKIGKVDEIYGLAYFDDVDYSVTAIAAGFVCLKALDTFVYHHRNVTFFQILKGPKWNELHEKNKLIYYKKWGRPLKFSLVINTTNQRRKNEIKAISRLIYLLGRRQHRVLVWTSDPSMGGIVRHTNVFVKIMPRPFLKLITMLDVYLNSRKKESKRYNGVFVLDPVLGKQLKKVTGGRSDIYFTEHEPFCDFVIKITDNLKEETRKA